MNFKLSNNVNLTGIKTFNNIKINKVDYHYEEDYNPSKENYEKINDQIIYNEKNIDTNVLYSAACNAAMATGGVVNGIANFGENIFDAGATVLTAVSTPFTILYDLFTESNTTEDNWNKTQAFVKEEHVNNAFENFYTNNEFGKKINETALEVMQYGNTGYNFANGVGYLSATIATAAVGGMATGASITTSGAISSGVSGFGRTTADSWKSGAGFYSGITAGVLAGGWDAAQWIFGAKIAGQGAKTVGLDVISGLADIPVRSGIQSIYNNQNIFETIEQNGGVSAILGNGILAGSFSAASEFVNLKNRKITYNNVNYKNSSDFFENVKGYNGNYGVDQGILKKINSTDKPYEEVKKYLKRLGFNNKDSIWIIKNLDSSGACSYAEFANEIFNSFKNKPQEFEKIFGYPMYTQDGNLNDSLLLVELYTFINNEANGGSLFKYSNNKANIVKKDTSNQQYLSYSISGKKKDIINNFLKSKDHNLTYDLEYLGHRVSKVDTVHTDPNTGKKTFDKYDTLTGQRILNNFDGKTGNPILYDIDSLKSSIIEALENDKNVGLSIFNLKYLNHFTMHSLVNGVNDVSTSGWDSGHAMFVTGVNEQGIIVSSWGSKFRIDWENLLFSGFTVSSSQIK